MVLLKLCSTLILLSGLWAAPNSRCSYSYKIDGYYLYALRGYSRKGGDSTFCQWNIASDTRVRFTCKNPITNCDVQFAVYEGQGSQPMRYCSGSFTHQSLGDNLNIELTGPPNIPKGSLNCELQAISCKCGWKKPASDDVGISNFIEDSDWPADLNRSKLKMSNNTRIVGGLPTLINEYPMMAGMLDFNRRTLYCGATIISDRYVLTAAHCLEGRSPGNMGVLTGDYDLSTSADTDATNIFMVDYFFIHPDYLKKENYFDIGLVRIIGQIETRWEVGPVCLPFEHTYNSFENEYVTLLGWGTTSFGGALSRNLQKVSVQVTDFYSCQQYYPTHRINQICTFTKGKDACQFDSGGPVLWQDPSTGRIVLVGIISYGIGCGDKTPSLNTRVTETLRWIEDMTPEVQYCKAE